MRRGDFVGSKHIKSGSDLMDILIEIEDYISERIHVKENISMSKANQAYTANDKLAKILTGFDLEEWREGEE